MQISLKKDLRRELWSCRELGSILSLLYIFPSQSSISLWLFILPPLTVSFFLEKSFLWNNMASLSCWMFTLRFRDTQRLSPGFTRNIVTRGHLIGPCQSPVSVPSEKEWDWLNLARISYSEIILTAWL